MSIRQVSRVQCDGPCKGWLGGDDSSSGGLICTECPPQGRAGNWPTEEAAQRAAWKAGWRPKPLDADQWLCPADQAGVLYLNTTDPDAVQLPRPRTGARFIVTGKYEPDGTNRGVPYSAVDVGVDAYENPAMRLRITGDVHEHFAITHTGVTDVESFWLWMPDGDRIEGTNDV